MPHPHPVLIELAAGRPLPSSVDDPEHLLTTALEHRMQGLLWSAVMRGEIELPLETERRLAVFDLRTQAHHRRLWAVLEEVTALLAQHEIEVATFKGVAAEARWYDRVGERPSRDLDLWLSPHQIGRVDDAVRLLQPGHPLVGRLTRLVDRGHLQSIDVLWGDESVDFHVDPFKLGVPSRVLGTLWDRKIDLGSGVSMLDPAASLALFLVHLNKDRFSWLLGFVDVTRIIDTEPEAAARATEIATQDGFLVPVSKSMAMVASVLGRTSPPSPASGWRARAWDRLWPSEVMLGGDNGFLHAHRRQFLLPYLAPGRVGEATGNIVQIALPPSDLLEIYFPDVPGWYPFRLIRGRFRRWSQRRWHIRRSEEDPAEPPKSGVLDIDAEMPASAPKTVRSPLLARPSRGAFLVVAGPDGAGKTTLARAVLARVGNRGRYFHFIPSPVNTLQQSLSYDPLLVEKNREDGSRVLGLLRIGRNLVRAWISYVMSIRPAVRSGSVVVGDRWLYGYVVQPLALKFYGPEWVAEIILRLMPQPDLVVILDAPAEVIRGRKAELSVAEIEDEKLQWAQIGGRTLTLDATRPAEELATETLNHIATSVEFRRYPPTLGHVLLPAGDRSAALVGSTLYTAARTRGLLAQRLGRGMLRTFGTAWLPTADPADVPFPPAHREALIGLLADNGLKYDSIALYTRTQDYRTGYSVLVISDGRPVGFVRVGIPSDLEAECRALELLDLMGPETFHHPRLLDRSSLGSVDLALQTVVLEGYHRPPSHPPLDKIVSEIQSALSGFPKPPNTPSHWVPLHGDFTPWNLRQTGGRLSLIDWESVGWGPPLADQVLYIAASKALGLRRPASDWSTEAASFWLKRIGRADTSRDARLGKELLKVLEEGGSQSARQRRGMINRRKLS